MSEIGLIWSPHTLPPSTAAVDIIISGTISWENTAEVIGSIIAKVPHDVPVENASNKEIIKYINKKL